MIFEETKKGSSSSPIESIEDDPNLHAKPAWGNFMNQEVSEIAENSLDPNLGWDKVSKEWDNSALGIIRNIVSFLC